MFDGGGYENQRAGYDGEDIHLSRFTYETMTFVIAFSFADEKDGSNKTA